jgi:hypothetical protein
VIDEAAADLFLRELGDRTVVECLPAERRELLVVDPQRDRAGDRRGHGADA